MIVLTFKGGYRVLLAVLTPMSLTLLASCANSEIGKKLSESFGSQSETSFEESISNNLNSKSSDQQPETFFEEPTTNKLNLTSLSSLPREPLGEEREKELSSPKIETSSEENDKKSEVSNKEIDKYLPLIPFTPSPYRITIKLSDANPSAPAETVTNALRKAGVNFEVESIERVKVQNATKIPLNSFGKRSR